MDKRLLANGYLAWFLCAVLNACSEKLFKMHYILHSSMTCSHREHFDMEMCEVCENHWAKRHNYRRDLHDNVTQPTWLLQSKTGGTASDKINDCYCVYHSEGPGGAAAHCVWNCFSINVGACGSEEQAAFGFRCSHTRPFLVCRMHFLGFCCAPSWQPAGHPTLSPAETAWQLVTAVKVERWGRQTPNEALLLMRLGSSLSVSAAAALSVCTSFCFLSFPQQLQGFCLKHGNSAQTLACQQSTPACFPLDGFEFMNTKMRDLKHMVWLLWLHSQIELMWPLVPALLPPFLYVTTWTDCLAAYFNLSLSSLPVQCALSFCLKLASFIEVDKLINTANYSSTSTEETLQLIVGRVNELQWRPLRISYKCQHDCCPLNGDEHWHRGSGEEMNGSRPRTQQSITADIWISRCCSKSS